MIVLDTSLLSVVLRHRKHGPDSREVAEFHRLVKHDASLGVPGIVFQELLSGVRSPRQFKELRDRGEGFSILLATRGQHVAAARLRNRLLDAGVVCSTVDALIAAQTIAISGELFTLDRDFDPMTRHCGLKLYRIPSQKS